MRYQDWTKKNGTNLTALYATIILKLMEKVKLKIDNCGHDAARYAVMNWHYSKAMPSGKLVKYGVWEDDKFIGAVIFGRGANNNIGHKYGLTSIEICELVRVALTKHKTPVTRILSICLNLLKKQNPGLVLVVSYADKTNQGHEGVIYKAGNWIYEGESVCKSGYYVVNGVMTHARSVSAKYGTIGDARKLANITKQNKELIKHKYIMYLREKK